MGRLLTLDVGVTTGYAFFIDGQFQGSGNIEFSRLPVELQEMKYALEPTEVVAEMPIPIGFGELSGLLNTAMQLVPMVFPNVQRITAADWKGTRALTADLPQVVDRPKWTTHQKDAYRIGYWKMNFHLVY